MRKAPLIAFLVISLLWHTFATAHVRFANDHGDDISHVVLHLEKKPHHHHDDGSYHQDSTDESIAHVYSDGCANTAGVMPPSSHCGVRNLTAERLSSKAFAAHDSPILEGPRRPPRLAA